jgi:hypothetical protein
LLKKFRIPDFNGNKVLKLLSTPAGNPNPNSELRNPEKTRNARTEAVWNLIPETWNLEKRNAGAKRSEKEKSNRLFCVVRF